METLDLIILQNELEKSHDQSDIQCRKEILVELGIRQRG
jgi:hypothetical protein